MKAIEAIKEIYGKDAEVEPWDWEHWGLPVFMVDGRREVAVAKDEAEAIEAVKAYIRESIWAFNTWFILNHCDLPFELETCLQAFQSSECEGANEAILALIDKCGDLDRFAEEAIDADGIGPFLDHWDGEEEIASNGCLIFEL